MKGKVCLITGASSGIGKETAIGLARMGATIVMVGRTKGKAEAAREEVVAKTRSESVELTKEFIRRLPDVWPTINIPTPFGGTYVKDSPYGDHIHPYCWV